MHNFDSEWFDWGRWVTNTIFHSVWFRYNYSRVVEQNNQLALESFKVLDGRYYFLSKDLKKVIAFVADKIDREPVWFDHYFATCEKEIAKLSQSFPSKTSPLSTFFSDLCNTLSCSLGIELMDLAVQEYITTATHKHGSNPDDIFAAISPSQDTPLTRFSKQALNISQSQIETFVSGYQWVGTHGFEGTPLTIEKLKEFTAESSAKKPRNGPPISADFDTIIKIASQLAYYRSYIVETSNMVSFRYWPAIKKLGSKLGLAWDEIKYLSEAELILAEQGKLTKIPDVETRQSAFGIIFDNDKTRVITGSELQAELEKTQSAESVADRTEITGRVAQGGTARGVVRIVESSADFSKFQNGDVLVANETTPDFMLVIKKASAIVTNVGGITCHAAIVSRELGIPCIIGTKVATRVLKDGDIVGVDADCGIVTIIR